MMYAFHTSSDGSPVHEVAASAETFPENVDQEVAGRAWDPLFLEGLQERTDGPARRFLEALRRAGVV